MTINKSLYTKQDKNTLNGWVETQNENNLLSRSN